MSFSIYQLLVPLFALLIIAKSISRLRRGEQNLHEFLIWLVIWGAVSYVALFPSGVVEFVARITGFKNGIFAIIFFALIILFYIVFTQLLAIEKLEREITAIVRNDALKKIGDKNKK